MLVWKKQLLVATTYLALSETSLDYQRGEMANIQLSRFNLCHLASHDVINGILAEIWTSEVHVKSGLK